MQITNSTNPFLNSDGNSLYTVSTATGTQLRDQLKEAELNKVIQMF